MQNMAPAWLVWELPTSADLQESIRICLLPWHSAHLWRELVQAAGYSISGTKNGHSAAPLAIWGANHWCVAAPGRFLAGGAIAVQQNDAVPDKPCAHVYASRACVLVTAQRPGAG
jgi:hypothetical protein